MTDMMDKAQWQRLKTFFQQARKMPRVQQAAFLQEKCGNDVALRAKLEQMLASDKASAGFLETPEEDIRHLLGASRSGEDPYIGKNIGPYRIERIIGEGGMGVVYLAVRADRSFKRQVAVKLLRRGMDTQALLERFHSERQALAALDHPHIARLLDGGSTSDGLPYFIMEYIDGLPVNDYCDTGRLVLKERLKLFRKICSAVSFAHQNLIIHRDLKPGNILVTPEGEPKLLDFGIARLLQPGREGLKYEPTITAGRFLTPEYASPEQVMNRAMTTASDVYSLGALLYYLLTGQQAHQFPSFSALDIERVICEQEPLKPSSAVLRREHTGMHGRVSAGPAKFAQQLSGDLDTIIMKALRKEPHRRYPGVQEFSADIRNYLQGLPVRARPETLSYIAGKFIRRHKSSVAAALLFLLSITGGSIATLWQAHVAGLERDKAQLEAQKAERINQFLQKLLASANSRWYIEGKAKGPDVTVVEVLNEAARRIESEIADQPDIQADLHLTIGDTYLSLGKHEACYHFEQAYGLRSRLYAEDDPKVIESLYYLALAQRGKADFLAAEQTLAKAIALLRGTGNEKNVYLPHAQAGLSVLYQFYLFKPEAAIPHAVDAVKSFRSSYGESHLTVTAGLANLASVYLDNGLPDLAEAALIRGEQILQENQAISEEDREMQWSGLLIQYGRLAHRQENFSLARSHYEQALELRKKWLGTDTPLHLSYTYFQLGKTLNALGLPEEAETCLGTALASYQTLPDSTWWTSIIRVELGAALHAQNRPGEAAGYLRTAYSVLSRAPEQVTVALAARQQAEALLGPGNKASGQE